jgi:multidrug transporter EmrE-like cation transporter
MLIKHWLPAAQAALRIGNVLTMPCLFVCSGAFLYIVSFLVWMVILARNDLTVAYPIAISLTLLLSTIGAAMLLGEPVSAMRTAGIAFNTVRNYRGRPQLIVGSANRCPLGEIVEC